MVKKNIAANWLGHIIQVRGIDIYVIRWVVELDREPALIKVYGVPPKYKENYLKQFELKPPYQRNNYKSVAEIEGLFIPDEVMVQFTELEKVIVT